MLKGFKDFILRGNLIELAVAFVIGAAFATVVNTMVSAVVTPIINAFPGATTNGWGFSLRGDDSGSAEDRALAAKTFIDISTLINALIVFLITALAVYLVLVVPMNKIKERRQRGEEPGPAEPTELELLAQIRDAVSRPSPRH